jgi:hypothetical protein
MFQSKTAHKAITHILFNSEQAELAIKGNALFREVGQQINVLVLKMMIEQGFAPVVVAFMEEVLNGRADHIVYQSADQIAFGLNPHIDREVSLQMQDAIKVAKRYSNVLRNIVEEIPTLVHSAFAA